MLRRGRWSWYCEGWLRDWCHREAESFFIWNLEETFASLSRRGCDCHLVGGLSGRAWVLTWKLMSFELIAGMVRKLNWWLNGRKWESRRDAFSSWLSGQSSIPHKLSHWSQYRFALNFLVTFNLNSLTFPALKPPRIPEKLPSSSSRDWRMIPNEGGESIQMMHDEHSPLHSAARFLLLPVGHHLGDFNATTIVINIFEFVCRGGITRREELARN